MTLNAFQLVRPRGVDRPSAIPIRQGAGKPPLPLPGSRARDLDGHCMQSQQPSRVYGGFTIEGRKQAQASRDKRKALMKGGL